MNKHRSVEKRLRVSKIGSSRRKKYRGAHEEGVEKTAGRLRRLAKKCPKKKML